MLNIKSNQLYLINRKKLLETQQKVQQHLKWRFGLNYIYEAISIRLIEAEPSEVVQYREV